MCLDDQILNTYIDGELSEPWKSQVEEHLSYCKVCKIRRENINKLRSVIQSAQVSDSDVKVHKDRVLSILEKNYINKDKKRSALHKQIRFTISQLIGVAAAFVVIFVGSFTVFDSKSEKSIPSPIAAPSVVDIANITPVRAVENNHGKTLDSYSLEEILQNLDARGYDVDVHLKEIRPIEETFNFEQRTSEEIDNSKKPDLKD